MNAPIPSWPTEFGVETTGWAGLLCCSIPRCKYLCILSCVGVPSRQVSVPSRLSPSWPPAHSTHAIEHCGSRRHGCPSRGLNTHCLTMMARQAAAVMGTRLPKPFVGRGQPTKVCQRGKCGKPEAGRAARLRRGESVSIPCRNHLRTVCKRRSAAMGTVNYDWLVG